MQTLILGGGWVGSRFCLKNPTSSIATARTREKVDKLTSIGVHAVEFDQTKEDTWKNLPHKESVSATVITFPLLKTQVHSWEKIFTECIPTDKPVLCLGTTSVFQSDGYESIVNEKAPLTALDVFGHSLADRTDGETWALSKGATILHLSGIVGDEEDASYGEPRFVRSFIESGYARNGLKLVNLIHIDDICNIITFFANQTSLRGPERVIVSCGAFRWQSFTKALGMDSLPEIMPSNESMKGSKILSTAKLWSSLPDSYKWTLPVSSVEPVSRGLPSDGCLEYFPNSTARNRQWELLKLVLRGKWQGSPIWYKCEDGDYTKFFAKMKDDHIPAPSLVIPFSEYHIYFLDADSGVWHGTGLHMVSGGEKIVPISRNTCNKSGSSFIFDGASGQAGVHLGSSNSFACKISFFYERSRSMLIVIYKPNSTADKFFLDSICVVSFRCAHGSNFPLKPSQAEKRRTVETLLAGLSNMTCRMQWMSHTRALDETNGGEIQQMPTQSMLAFSSSNEKRLIQSFDDLLCSVPFEIAVGDNFKLVFGCRHTKHLFKAATIVYTLGKLDRLLYETWTQD